MIQTKVAKIVSPTELIFAAGAEDGVEEGMEFIVYSLSEPVIDPDNGEELGRIEIVKAKLIAAHVQEHITVARTKTKIVKRIYDPMAELRESMSIFARHRKEYSELVHEQMSVEKTEPIPQPDLVVRVGDLARTISIPAKSRNLEMAIA